MTKPGKQNHRAQVQKFHNSPFRTLKGVVAEQPASPPKPVVAPPAHVATPSDDADLFLQAVSGVTRLHGVANDRPADKSLVSKALTKSAQSPTIAAEEQRDDIFLKEIQRLKLDAKFADNVPNEDELTPMTGNRLRQIKRGIVAVTRQLDLHGLTRAEALQELSRFLKFARTKGEKAVLVITGKGNHSAGEAVLQQAVAAWLTKAGRELVVEFAPAPREMGGSGAYVVFLRPTPPLASSGAADHTFKQ